MTLSVEELKLLFKNFEMKCEQTVVKINLDGQKVANTIQPSMNTNKEIHD